MNWPEAFVLAVHFVAVAAMVIFASRRNP